MKRKVIWIAVLIVLALAFNAHADDVGAPKTAKELEKVYKQWTDDINEGMNDKLYNIMTQQIMDAAMNGQHVWGAFLAQYLIKIIFCQ